MVRFTKKWYQFFTVFLSCILFSTQTGLSQYYLIGTDPSSVKWSQIKTKNFRVIYPRDLAGKGQYVANGLEYIYAPGSNSLFSNTPKTPVILHNQTTVPSSVTYIAPRRMEFFTTPPQDLYPQDWVDQLIIHEFRHAVQYSALNVGFTKGLYYLFGEQAVFGMFGLFLPMWLIEGDATIAETALHKTGRGRTPSFEMRLRAQIVEKGIYSYEKANYGSFKDMVPGKYELGYQLAGMARVNYNPEIWSKVFANIGRKPFTIAPISFSLKKQTGIGKYSLYDTLTKELQKTWINENRSLRENNYRVINSSPARLYTSYNLPIVFRDSLIISVKTSLEQLPSVVILNQKGEEKALFTLGANYLSESLSTSDSILYWSELVNDPRWLLRDYRVIKTYNFRTGKIGQLTHLSRYYAPSVTPDGNYIAAVDVSPENKYFLAILNSDDGSLVKRISTPDNLLFIHPRWSEDGKFIVSVVFGKKGNNLGITDPSTGITEILTEWTLMEMKRPSFYKHYIIYTASYNGKDNLYAFDRNTRDIFKVTNARFGTSDASISDLQSEIIYSNYTADGYVIVAEKLDPYVWTRTNVPEKSAFPLAEKLTEQEKFIYETDSVPENKYESKPYSKLLNLFNVHSWAPVGVDFQNFSALPGATIISQNLLGTTVSMLGYLYNRNEGTGKTYFSVSDESLYTAIDFRVDYGGRKDIGYMTTNDSVPAKWKELNLSAGLRLPLNWTHNTWIRNFEPSASINYKNLEMDESTPFDFYQEHIIGLKYSMKASNKYKTSLRDIYPKWSQEIQLDYNNTPFQDSTNSLLAGQFTVDLPGIGKHHGVRLYAGYQKRVDTNYPFEDIIIFPRGYTNIYSEDIYSLSAMYTMPLFYPEWQIGHLLYFKRFKTSVFYDFARSLDKKQNEVYSSIGIDLSSDFSFLNLITPLDAGLRTIYIPETGKFKFQMLFSLNFGGMY